MLMPVGIVTEVLFGISPVLVILGGASMVGAFALAAYGAVRGLLM